MVTTKYLAKFQGPRAITRPKIIGPERNVNLIYNSYTKNQVNISKHSEKKVVTTKDLTKFQSLRAITRPKIIEPERNVNLICKLKISSQYLKA